MSGHNDPNQYKECLVEAEKRDNINIEPCKDLKDGNKKENSLLKKMEKKLFIRPSLSVKSA